MKDAKLTIVERRCFNTALLVLSDLFLVALSYLSAAVLIYGRDTVSSLSRSWFSFLMAFFLIWVVFEGILLLFRSHNVIWRYAGYREYMNFAIASAVSGVAVLPIVWLIPRFEPISVRVIAVGILITLLLTGGVRLLLRFVRIKSISKHGEPIERIGGRIMIVGAGSVGYLLIHSLGRSAVLSGDRVVCIIDDDATKQGRSFYGVPVVGGREQIPEAVKKYEVETILFAIPSCPAEDKRDILNICARTGCRVKTSPSMDQMLRNPEFKPTQMRHIELEDLLERPPIRLSRDGIDAYLHGKTVMVTGVGSIGSELCRQIACYAPKRLILFDIYENNAYDLQMALKRAYPELELIVLIGSVRDADRLDAVFAAYKPEIVFHAAAHKHVPLMEDSPHEAIKNNVFGTLHAVRSADRHGVERFVLISTDKAVNPTNVMGASKRLCEMIVQSYARSSRTVFAAVRFGNVLGSNGSVVPLFRRQIEMGGPVTITHPDIIRYFMTIPEAVSLILEAGSNAKGGEIFVLDMGKPVRILDMAEKLIRLSGLRPYEDIEIRFIGLRPGEKLFEELLMNEEGLRKTANELICIGAPLKFDTEEFFRNLDRLERLLEDEGSDIRAQLHIMVEGYVERI